MSTSRLKSGGCGQLIPAAIALSRAASHCTITSFATNSNTPAALHSSVTAKPSFSSFALLSTSDSPRSTSYTPSESTAARARFESAKPYVRSVNASSAESEGKARRGDV